MIRAGMTLHGVQAPGDLLVRVHNDDSESPDAIVIVRDDATAMCGMMLGLDGTLTPWVPSSAWVMAYRDYVIV